MTLRLHHKRTAFRVFIVDGQNTWGEFRLKTAGPEAFRARNIITAG